MKSRIYTGHIMHERFSPARHVLNYPLYFYAFDLDELQKIHKKIRGFSYNKANIVSLRDSDYLRGRGSMKKRLMELLRDRAYYRSIHRVEVITSARYLGYVFNPVSFFCCFDRTGRVLCVVAEVNNTFGERHFYILDKKKARSGSKITFVQDKEFHVSPFNDRRGYYELSFSFTGEKVLIEVILFRDREKIMTARLTGKASELTSSTLRKTLVRFPFTVLLTVIRIYKEAAKLFFIKKLKYHKKPAPSSAMTITVSPLKFRQKVARRVVTAFLRRFMQGALAVTFPNGETQRFGGGSAPADADITIKGHDFFWKVFTKGDIGFGESYTSGLWDSSDVPALLRFSIDAIQSISERKNFLIKLSRRVKRIIHPVPRNSLRGSKKNIYAHYDLGNDFFKTFLDKKLIYSSALYHDAKDTLEKAQMNKILAVMEKASIGPGDRVLEIGSGWGGFAIEAARRKGCHVTTTTISQQQYDYVTGLVKKYKLQKKITVLKQDYRHVKGQFDKIVSIEMLEAIGIEYFGRFFKRCEALLKPGGIMVHQIIMMPDHRFRHYRNNRDWVREYIFPGGILPSLSVLTRAMEKHSSFYIEDLENIGPHYARTLYEWRRRFDSAAEKLMQMGYDEEFQRKWRYYLMVCEAAFAKRIIYDAVIVFSRQYNSSLPLDKALRSYDNGPGNRAGGLPGRS